MAAAWDQKIRLASEKALTWHLQQQTERENPCLCVRHALESFNFCRPSMAERSARCLTLQASLRFTHFLGYHRCWTAEWLNVSEQVADVFFFPHKKIAQTVHKTRPQNLNKRY